MVSSLSVLYISVLHIALCIIDCDGQFDAQLKLDEKHDKRATGQYTNAEEQSSMYFNQLNQICMHLNKTFSSGPNHTEKHHRRIN